MWKAALHVNGFRPSMTVVYQDKISNYFFLSVYIWFEWHINKLHIGLMPTPGPIDNRGHIKEKMMTAKSDRLLENIVINKNILKPTRKRNENLGRVEDHI